jgi:hypothetical protein
MRCPPGELLLEDGKTCQKAGVPPSACGLGFLPDGKEGCEPILPADPCPEGLMAVPGDTECHEVSPCGSGTWGDIPVEANTQFVDKAYAGGNSDGTQAKPWTTIQQAVTTAASGAIVAVAAGSYAEDVVIYGKAVRLWGRCPALVEVVGTGAEFGAIQVLQTAAVEAEVHGVAVTGARYGIAVSGASDVVIEGVWIHTTGKNGLAVQDDLGLTSVTLKGSLLEKNYEMGVSMTGSDVTIEATVIRSTLFNTQGRFGRGINAQPGSDSKERTSLTVRACVIEQNHEVGIFVASSDATIEATVVRFTQPHAATGTAGFGIGLQIYPTEGRADVTVRACLIEQNHQSGIFVVGSDATIEATVIRETLSNEQGESGRGISIKNDESSLQRANVTVRACLVEQNHNAGVYVVGSDATIEATVVRSNSPDVQGLGGRGINIQNDPATKARASVAVRACRIEQHHELGVFVAGAYVTIESTVIRSAPPDAPWELGRGIDIRDGLTADERADVVVRACLIEQNHGGGVSIMGSDVTIESIVVSSTLPDAEGNLGRGLSIHMDHDTNERSSVTVRASLIEQNHEAGVFIGGSDATIVDSIVRDTASQKSDSTFGDGITVFDSAVTIQNVEITLNARAGVASFGSQVVITGGVITCNGFDLEGESIDNIPFTFDGSTGWQCSDKAPAECTVLGDCHVESIGIEAPKDLPAADPLPQ